MVVWAKTGNMPDIGIQCIMVIFMIILTSIDPLNANEILIRYSGISEHLVYDGFRKFPRFEMLA